MAEGQFLTTDKAIKELKEVLSKKELKHLEAEAWEDFLDMAISAEKLRQKQGVTLGVLIYQNGMPVQTKLYGHFLFFNLKLDPKKRGRLQKAWESAKEFITSIEFELAPKVTFHVDGSITLEIFSIKKA
ncbi:MAG: Adenylylsulfate reductase, alpha subunit [Candidatus Moranbacteria bacterium GW2011_GWC1_45_18]|nr:MAG: Adenylylsulfate reductase, alpha subunit [Candidatus Moranbacteria bacterium GW2011_GWC2_40_12]KKT34130.1 MAG: Adenylylsulfate reductase, alpha subunit [Candidatus Moranbacteria bacterium GW2011_GWF2_44_10]KKT70287.1 MAG: Adenylylsulfate reductase, alpha subunit [Candidatus Moranbacteria bacterium GW2011_GWF1_44_4]KKU00658.1 MAG: Adenylylsulfate reductase, alpha subunit [Candidatus Moranbacteria bacterium GW2011_GWC1_45_18]OGI23604.1 MAG: hypothetical protein A2194_02540 [Candidatus Mor